MNKNHLRKKKRNKIEYECLRIFQTFFFFFFSNYYFERHTEFHDREFKKVQKSVLMIVNIHIKVLNATLTLN